MAKTFFVKAKYTSAGTNALLKSGGSVRRQSVEKMMNDLGGSLESFYFSLNADEAYIVCTMPDDITAAAVSLNVDSTGMVDCSIVPLLTPEDIDAAAKKVIHYRAPGQ